MNRRPALIALLCLAACAPQPRSASYFEAHRDEAAAIVSACQAGSVRGAECVNAQAGAAAAARDARMANARKVF